MVDDLLDDYDFSGMARSQLIALLGDPDGWGQMTGWDVVYHLGPERGVIQMDSEWLAFRLDEEQRVEEYRIIVP